jgi:hypothetical protein
MKETYEPILEDHITIDTCKFSSEFNAKKIASQIKKKNEDTKC